ncbi:MAG: amidase [Rhodospirillaceae bacterium]|nr:amidase [Rhodospirillaceae bacterium]
MRDLPAELWKWNAVDLARAISLGVVSSREAVAACLDRLTAVNPRINAIVTTLGESALAAADSADAALRAGEALGPLHGVPVTVKDNVDQAGFANVDGIGAFKDRIAREDHPVVANWRKAGAVIIGRSNTPAFSARWDTDNAVYGRSWNPWSRRRTAGGSSGGAAAALACGIGPLAHGNDIGGSIRYPAFCCGVVGLRPTMGRVASFNASAPTERPPTSQMMAVNGLLARRIGDLRLGLEAMSGRDPRDPSWVPAPLEGPPPERPIRVAMVTSAPGLYVHPTIEEAVRKAAAALTDAGYLVEEAVPPSIEDAAALWARLGAADTRHLAWPSIEKLADDGVRRVNSLFLEAVPDLTLPEYLQALAKVQTHRRAWSRFFETYPLILGPNSGDLPFEIGFDSRDLDAMRHLLKAQALMVAVNLLGLPAVAVPTGTTTASDAPQGLPTGVQIIAGRYREDLAFDAAEAIEARHGLSTPIEPSF